MGKDAKAMMKASELCEWLQICRSKLNTLMASSRIPQPLRLGYSTIRWDPAVIDAWIEDGCPRCASKDYPDAWTYADYKMRRRNPGVRLKVRGAR